MYHNCMNQFLKLGHILTPFIKMHKHQERRHWKGICCYNWHQYQILKNGKVQTDKGRGDIMAKNMKLYLPNRKGFR
jgi:hypothetical protein